MSKWKCKLCGYVYDEEVGEPDNGIDAGSKFDDLSDDYKCPICGAAKNMFGEMD